MDFSFNIFAEEVRQSVTALAYCLEAEDNVVVYSGDTEPCPRVALWRMEPTC